MAKSRNFTVCYKKYSGYVKCIALNYLNDYYDAEDVSQDVFIKLYERLDLFDNEKTMKAWLSIVTRNKAIDIKRKLHKDKLVPMDDCTDKDMYNYRIYKEPIEDYMLKKELLSNILISINEMGEDLQNVLRTQYLSDVNQEKACKTLGVEVGTYRVRLFRARKKLKERFQKDLEEIL